MSARSETTIAVCDTDEISSGDSGSHEVIIPGGAGTILVSGVKRNASWTVGARYRLFCGNAPVLIFGPFEWFSGAV
jgi:hypothetical protein